MSITFCADIGSNHGGNWEGITESIDIAKDAGVDIVKFQLFQHATTRTDQNNIEFPRELWPDTVAYAKKVGIDIFASVFCHKKMESAPSCMENRRPFCRKSSPAFACRYTVREAQMQARPKSPGRPVCRPPP